MAAVVADENMKDKQVVLIDLWKKNVFKKLVFKEDIVTNIKISRHFLLVICENFSYLHRLNRLKDVKKFETGKNSQGFGDLAEVDGIPKVILPSKTPNHFKVIIDKYE